MEYRVRLNQDEVRASLRKAERMSARASAKGLVGGWTFRVETVTETQQHPLLGPVQTEATYLVWEGSPMSLGGWHFVAVVEWIETGPVGGPSTWEPITRVLPGYEGEVIDRAWVSDPVCDHCKTRRLRNHVVIVERDGVRMRVGSTCVKDFLGWDFSPTFFAEPTADEGDGWGGGWSPSVCETRVAVAAAVRVVHEAGWVSRGVARDTDKRATADLVDTLLWGSLKDRDRLFHEYPALRGPLTEAEYAEADHLVEWGQHLGEGEYALNLATALRATWTTYKTMGLVASVVGVWQRAQAREEARKAENLAEEQYAPAKTRVRGLRLKVVAIRDWEGVYGVTHAHTFVGEGHRFSWKTGTVRLTEGQEYTVTGTVKGSREWQGKVFTELTRCSVE